MKNVLLPLLILFCVSAYSQNKPEYKLTLDSRGMGNSYRIEILQSHAQNLLVVVDYTKTNVNEKDSLQLVSMLESGGPEKNKAELEIILERSWVRDTLWLAKADTILEVTDTFIEDWEEAKKEVEKKEKELADGKIITLDGFGVKISFQKEGEVVGTIYVRNPSERSHPTIAQFIADVKGYYKSKAENPVLH